MALTRHWKCDDNAANAIVVDATGNDDASLIAGKTTEDKQTGVGPGGSITWSFDFDGTEDYIEGIFHPRASTEPWTYSLWVSPDVTNTNITLWGRTSNNSSSCYIPSAGTLRVVNGNIVCNFIAPEFTAGQWYHVFVVKDSSNNLRVWVNGVESSTGALPAGTFTNSPTHIGTAQTGGFDMDGKITQFRMWDTDESAAVATWYAEGIDATPDGAMATSALPAVRAGVMTAIQNATCSATLGVNRHGRIAL